MLKLNSALKRLRRRVVTRRASSQYDLINNLPSGCFTRFRSQSSSSTTPPKARPAFTAVRTMRSASHYVALLLTALSVSNSSAYSSDTCQSILTGSYPNAVAAYPHLKHQIELVARQQVAQWYTDRVSDVSTLAKSVVLPKCVESPSTPTVIVYGLPQKDCAHGYSTAGSNANANDYRVFLQELADAAGDRQIVYILEPDAIGLLANSGCGNDKGYAANLGVAMDILSQNSNAELYLDVGYWTLSNEEQAAAVAKIVNAVDPDARCKGISLNTSNYRSNAEMIATCERFVKASGRDYKCIVDTSRNFVSGSSEWCNSEWAGIGEFPTSNTGSSVVSRFIWAKPPGESDGECTGQSNEALRGPSAGTFFPDHFEKLWDNGVFVRKLGMAPISAPDTTNNSTEATPAPTTVQPTPSTSTDQTVVQDVDITSLTAFDVYDDAVGLVNAGDQWEDSDDNQVTTTATTPKPTSSAPVLVEVEPPHAMVVVDVIPDDEYVDSSDSSDFTRAKEDSSAIRKHKACH